MTDPTPDDQARADEALRPLVFAIAYRMLGSVSEAEDLVQEALLRLYRARSAGEAIASPKAWLSAVTTRLAIDHLRAARVQREQYIGPWLPEPLVGDAAPSAAEPSELADSLSLAFLVLLERLSPLERAAFLLREVFDLDYADVAEALGRTEATSRQLVARAKKHVSEGKPRFEASPERRDAVARSFFDACRAADANALARVLAEDVALVGDGGGKAPALASPARGRDRVSHILVRWLSQGAALGFRIEPTDVNGQPGARVVDDAGRLVNVIALDIADGAVQCVRSIVNPDKLAHLGERVDLQRVLRERAASGGAGTKS